MSPPTERLKLQGWNSSMPRKVDRECGCERHQRRGNFSPAGTGRHSAHRTHADRDRVPAANDQAIRRALEITEVEFIEP
jgi:hypothetical protein